VALLADWVAGTGAAVFTFGLGTRMMRGPFEVRTGSGSVVAASMSIATVTAIAGRKPLGRNAKRLTCFASETLTF